MRVIVACVVLACVVLASARFAPKQRDAPFTRREFVQSVRSLLHRLYARACVPKDGECNNVGECCSPPNGGSTVLCTNVCRGDGGACKNVCKY